jgi:hypothetical protein
VIHFYRYLAALTVLLIAFSTYALAIAPWFEPPPIAKRETAVAPHPRPPNSDLPPEIAALFPPDHWAHKDPKIIKTDQCTVLIQDYRTPDGKLELTPCLLIFYSAPPKTPPGEAAAAPKRGRPIVLEAPKAELVFERPLDVMRADFGRVEKGTLSGEVTIYSPPSSPRSRDELQIRTRAVWIDRQSIKTENDVEFRFGDSFGRGRMLHIGMRQQQPGEKKAAGPFGNIQSITLKQLDYLHVATAGRGLLGDAIKSGDKAAADQNAPLEVTCQGEFAFDVVSQVARFQDRVEVRRLNPAAPADQLHCEELLLAMGRPGSAASATSPADDPFAGRLQRIIAIGLPATLNAPSSGITAKAAFMEYSLVDRYITLKSGPQNEVRQVSLHRFDQHFVAPDLHYQLAEQGRLGRLDASGPGELRLLQGRAGAQQVVTARWQRELHMQPQEGDHVISLVGPANVTVDPLGRFDANEMHLWVTETTEESGVGNRGSGVGDQIEKPKSAILADRLLAIGNVRLASPQLDADTSRMEAWFINLPAEPSSAEQPSGPIRPPGPIREPVAVMPASFTPAAPPQGMIRDVIRPPNPQKFHVGGELIRMQLLVRGQTFDLEDLNIRDHAEIDETRTAEPGQEPIHVRGDFLEVRHGTQPDATLEITGQPASIAGRGMSLAGGKIEVFRSRNELQINGPGEATLPAGSQESGARGQGPGTRALGGTAGLPSSALTGVMEKMHIVWQQGLLFDGLTARFNGDVQVRSATQTALAPVLEATLTDRIDFQMIGQSQRSVGQVPVGQASGLPYRPAGPQNSSIPVSNRPQPELATVFLDGGSTGVYIEGRSLNELGEQVSRDQANVRNLHIDRTRGTLHADGPGWVSSVRRGSPSGVTSGPGSAVSLAPSPQPLASGPSQLTSIHVSFQREITGDLARREITFHQQVQTTYSPALDFNDTIKADPLADLKERMVLMQSDALTVTEFIQPTARWFEMRASGHTQVRGERLDINAPIVQYSSANEVLTIEGDGRAQAQIWMHQATGGPPNRMQGERLRYNLRTGAAETDRVSEINVNLGPNIKLPKMPAGIGPKTGR